MSAPSFTVDLPCPGCGQRRILGYLLKNQHDKHMHTHYVCTFWAAGASFACGWHGWTLWERSKK